MVDLANEYLELATTGGDKIKVLRKSHPRARRLRLTVTSGGARLTYPEGTHPAQVFAFLRKHGEWLERKLDELSLRLDSVRLSGEWTPVRAREWWAKYWPTAHDREGAARDG